ncbi:Protein kinase domain [Arabidopsis thaliana x Arabidopsis arenosa]|uniref:Receptor-like serine/threonine-protein kinase n=1 Tax=Arabidopsis thaliana x Arabidopsis arenosa TaxID=1240361 RepID=A0A8T2BMQ4_9BRAS|nr:Protein kinase domain [Arabidopsis thaliana x Arabidopsis arenosa]
MAEFCKILTFVTTLLTLLQLCSIVSCSTSNAITRNHTLRDGDSLISEDESFEVGFFSPKNSTLRYVGIWYKNIEPQTVVWVANREKPLLDHNGALKIADDGNLVVVNGQNVPVWSTNVKPESNNTVAVLFKTGDLVLSSDSDRSKWYWESFNNPTDTFLPGMRVRVNPSHGENRAFTPWKSENDPSPGKFSMGIDPVGALEIVIWEGEKRKWRSGPWNSAIFTGIPDMFRFTNYIYGFKLSTPDRDGSVYFTYVASDSSDFLRFWIRFDGVEEQFRWNKDAKNWTLLQWKPSTECEKYNRCGNYSVCDDSKEFDSGKCSCLDGFEPVHQDQWNNKDFSGGCQRRVPLNCNQSVVADQEDGFKVLKGIKVPDFGSVVLHNNSETCKDVCARNCSCKAYAVVLGIGCMIWTRDLIDMEHFERGGNSINIRLAGSELGGGKEKSKLLIIIFSVIGAFLLGLCIWILWKRLKAFLWKKKELPVSDIRENREHSVNSSSSPIKVLVGDQVDTPDLPIFSFESVASATGDFAEENKLGQGGFGTVYKGNFSEGREIAVKRLSGKSKQGLEEFKNEILLIAKLQHRNLVRLLGCCIEDNEKMLLYEYMPNKSLDRFLFDESKRGSLDWRKRWEIIGGIARGLLYLHRDSRLKIIHRDLKASNILLDTEMNPKISDFGMARIFNYRQDQANTIRVVGTYGYMAPEYAMEGIFSEKSDVYSFGVLILEIVSGRKNLSFRGSEHGSLIGYAWHLWSQGKTKELIDPTVKDTRDVTEAMRCIHVGMLCTQDSVIHRPNIGSVLLMLESRTSQLPRPRQPTFHSFLNSGEIELNLDGHDVASVNDVTFTTIVGR